MNVLAELKGQYYREVSEGRARELVLTPVAGLYMAGYQAYSRIFLGGVPSAMNSGLTAARYLLKGKGPAGEVLIP